MKNKKARQSAIDVYGNIYCNSEHGTIKSKWAFDRLRNAECGFNRSESHMSHRELDLVSINSQSKEQEEK